MTVTLRSGGRLAHNAPQVMSPRRAQDDSAEQHAASDESAAEEAPDIPAAPEFVSIVEAAILAADCLTCQVLTLFVVFTDDWLTGSGGRTPATDHSRSPPPATTTAGPTPPGPSAPNEPSEPSEPNLAKHTEKLLGKEVPLPKLVNQKVEYARWKSKVTLWFPTFKLDTHGGEWYDSALSYTSMKYHTWYNTRRVMAFTVMALYLGMFLRDLLKGDGVNPDYILRNLLNHELKLGQTVEAYVAKSEELERRLRQAKSRMIGVSDATRRLRQAEQACMQVANLQPQATVLRAAQVSYVNEGQGRKAGRKKPQGAKMEELAKKKASPECSNCSKLGHWYAECTATTGKP
ncbi:hypothetical protein PR003_g5077 [Phytophthora rubi]|uniref:Uncharacterized protein n=1 Tax=Phytophthora rubi TaxID=129364 RepID=A0A6A4G3W5_9STRA|nr:hypothetical protein PR003_g5077 [Phytophthora rubi]